MSQESRLVKNTAIYAVGNISSKVLTYVMVIVYSHYISPDELGYYDIVVTTVSMFLPIVMVELHEGMYRYLVSSGKYRRTEVLATSFKVLSLVAIFSELVFFSISRFINIELSLLIMFYSLCLILYCTIQMAVRGLSDNKLYATVGVINSLIILVCEVIGIVLLHYGIDALLFSMGFAYLTSSIIFFIKKNKLKVCFRSRINGSLLKELLKYSVPLIPTTICWAVVSSCDRFIILFYLGPEYNGMFAMSAKFPTVITAVTSIFYMAWQESAIKEYHSPSRDSFFSKVFDKYAVLLFSSCFCCIPAMKFMALNFLDVKYSASWMFTGALFLAACYMALSSFLGLGYQISKQTLKSTVNSMIAAVTNVIINLAFIKLVGLHAASTSTLVSYMTLFFIRVYDTKRYFTINYNWGKIVCLQIVSILLIIFTFVVDNSIAIGCVTISCIMTWLYLNKFIIEPIVKKMTKMVIGRLYG